MNSNNRRMKRQMRDQLNHNQTICVSNATNSRSPNDLKSRIFIGNLNTSVITKRHLHLIFVQFGEIKAISMHKGYAFIQYDDQMDAINAVLSQDGQMLAGQAIDVNLVTEPKPHQKLSKTSTVSNGSETSGELTADTETNSMDNSLGSDSNFTKFENTINEMIVDSDLMHPTPDRTDNCASIASNSNCDQHSLQLNVNKRAKLDIHSETGPESNLENNDISMENNKSYETNSQCPTDPTKGRSDCKTNTDVNRLSDNNCCYLNDQNSSLGSLLSNPTLSLLLSGNNSLGMSPGLSQESVAMSQPGHQSYDIMICGNCRTLFTCISLFIQHKRLSKCRLRFVCRCQPK